MLRQRYFIVCHQLRHASTKRIESVLVANRGEIALRIMRTARKLDIKSVAVFSDADSNAQHKKFADQAFRIGKPPPTESYLCGDRVIDVALKAGVQAIHPGYGFLSENAEFAEKCQQAGIIFIGPPSNAIRKMGMKNEAKKIMIAANVPTIQGYNDENQDPDYLFEQAKQIGFPVMIKAVYGGGGKGMRIAKTETDFHQALESAKSESSKAFGNAEMIIEKFVERPRHVEVQIFGDTHNNYVYLWERDCSIQRRHQKIIEGKEAPAPGLSMETRRKIGEAGANAARAVDYVGAGTVEFIMDPNTQKFYFMEMNTRLQVEHPISEAITGLDFVEWQFKVAEGGKIPLRQEEIPLNGHALEARIYAEDNNFMPTAGLLEYLSFPKHARVDSGVVQGDAVSVFYDPMIAKVIVHGTDRTDAIRKLNTALSNTHIGGLPNNVEFVQRCLNHPEFISGNVSTDFIEENDLLKIDTQTKPNERSILEGVCSRLLLQAYDQTHAVKGPFGNSAFFRLNHNARIKVDLSKDAKFEATVVRDGSKIKSIRIDNNLEANVSNIAYSLTDSTQLPQIQFSIEHNDQQWTVKAVQLENSFAVYGSERQEWPLTLESPDYNEAASADTELQSRAPMPGVVEKVFVKVGDVANAGQALCSLIAMKMEYVLKAPFKCKIENVACAAGKSVQKNAVLIKFEKVE